MKNVSMVAEGGELIIRVKVDGVQGTPSASGKSMVLGSTEGNVAVPVGDRTVVVGLNVYTRK